MKFLALALMLYCSMSVAQDQQKEDVPDTWNAAFGYNSIFTLDGIEEKETESIFSNLVFKAFFGTRFERYDSTNMTTKEQITVFTGTGYLARLQLNYAFSAFNMFVASSFNAIKLERYDGLDLSENRFSPVSYSIGGSLSFLNFYTGYEFEQEEHNYFEVSGSTLLTAKQKRNKHIFSLGHIRPFYWNTFLRPYIKLGYIEATSSDINSEEKGDLYVIGLMWMQKGRGFGILIEEGVSNYNGSNADVEHNYFKILPYFKF